MLYARSFPVVHRASSSCRVSNRIGIDFADECTEYGFPLNVSTVMLSGTVVPSSAGNRPTDSATTGSPQDPPTGLPSNFFGSAASTSDSNPSVGDSGGPATTSQKGPTSSTTGSPGGKSGAVRVGNKAEAEVICVLFSVCLTAVLMAMA